MHDWLLARTLPNREFAAASILQDHFGFIVYFPVVHVKRKSGRIKEPFLPRYLFIVQNTGQRSLEPGQSLRNNGNTSLFQFVRRLDKTPMSVPQSVIDDLRAREDSDGFIPITPIQEHRFSHGDKVKVIDDAGFDTWDAMFSRMRGSHRAELFLAHLGRITVPITRVRAVAQTN